ncbi:ATP-binding cassette domain-containing protein [Streptomyces sp. NPDC046928]|uniref:ATP-binding cassette domain-containing protein n=1 Tax=Streptomyces sp. NPDC046928 TaxID=3155021 RepID=UPI0033E0B839
MRRPRWTVTASVEICGLTVRYSGVTAVQDFTLSHSSGGVIGLIGPNGAGRTTLLNTLSGLTPPTSGTVRVNGRDVTEVGPMRTACLRGSWRETPRCCSWANLSRASRAESVDLTALFTDIAAEGVTVVRVEHDVAGVFAVSGRVLVLDHGRLLVDGTSERIAADPVVRAAYLGEET